jgi:uncharacterized RDD family membrane protein YckC
MVAPQPDSDPTAVFGRRVVAGLIDLAVVLGPSIALATSQMEYLTRGQVGSGFDSFCSAFTAQEGGTCFQLGDRAYFNGDQASPGNFAFLAISLILLVVIQGLTGWTVGKVLTGIRTVNEDGRAPGIGRALVRWLLFIVDGPCQSIVPVVGFITALTTQGHRRVGDMVAKTFVVRRSAAGAPIVVPGFTAPPATPLAYAVSDPWAGTAVPSTTDPSAAGWAAPGTAPASGPGPQWDAARNAYIQWDPAQNSWLQWDEATHTWSPIPGQ